MPLIPAKCTQCGANIIVDDAKEASICESCGTAFITEKAINNYNTTNHYSAEVINVFNAKDGELSSLIRRISILLEDGEFSRAGELCEKTLNYCPENAELYVGKLMAELRVKRKEDLSNCTVPFDDNSNYKKVIRFGDSALIDELNGYLSIVKNRIEQQRKERERKAKILKKYIVIASSVVVTIVAFVLILNRMIIPAINYNNAVSVMEDGRYAEAIAEFEALDGYSDSDEKILECKYKIAISLADSGQYVEAIDEFRALDGYKASLWRILECRYNIAISLMNSGQYAEAIEEFKSPGLNEFEGSAELLSRCEFALMVENLKSAQVGDYVIFGAYEQLSDRYKNDIEWLVLGAKNSKVLLISKYALDCQPYNTNDTAVSWEACSLRQWLNNDFLTSAFSTEEQTLLSEEKVFLLTENEAREYFNSNRERMCEATNYAEANGAGTAGALSYCCWWLSSGDGTNEWIPYVDNIGAILEYGSIKYDADYAIRPAVWLDLSENN